MTKRGKGMGGGRFPFPACVIAGKGQIDDRDVLLLRRHAYPQGLICVADAQSMLALHRACPHRSDAWNIYLIESLAAFLVHDSCPVGVIDEHKTGWILQFMCEDGAVATACELNAILHAMDLAADVCDQLRAFVMDQLRLSLEQDGRGAYHDARMQDARRTATGLDARDLAFLWRLLAGTIDGGRLSISAAEADVLRRIDTIVAAETCGNGWREIIAWIDAVDRIEGGSRRTSDLAMEQAA